MTYNCSQRESDGVHGRGLVLWSLLASVNILC